MRNFKTFLALLFALIPLVVSAQYYSGGTDPARVRWRQIQTGPYRIIYPKGIDSLAYKYAWLFEKATPHVLAPLQAKAPYLPVVLHPYNMFSNGVVTWAPKRMELYTTPPAFSYAQSWEKQLVLHETRHVGQMYKLGRNVFSVLEYLIGQQSEGLAAGLYVSKWMMEGDAVISETEHSFSGRGREAAFLMPYRAYLMDSISFHWDKWRYGSYKDFIPNRYQFGYYLLSSIRYQTQFDILSHILDMITKRPYDPFINGVAFHKLTGRNRIQSWDPATELMRSIWAQQEAQSGPFTPYKEFNKGGMPKKQDPQKDSAKKRNPGLIFIENVLEQLHEASNAPDRPKDNWKKPSQEYVDYTSIVAVAEDSIYVLKNDLSHAQRLIQMDNKGKEKTLRYTGPLSSYITAGGGKLFWTELVPGLRWEQESFSVLRSYDPRTKKFGTLTKKSRYLHPSVAPSAKQMAVVYAAATGESELHLLNAANGLLQGSFPAPGGGRIQGITWASDSLLYTTTLTDNGLAIYSLDIAQKHWSNIVSPQYQSISRLSYSQGLLYFSSNIDGTDNIYALDPAIPQPFKLINAKYGAFDPFPFQDQLYYSNYSSSGLRAVAAAKNDLAWTRTSFETPYEAPVAQELSQQAQFRIDTVPVPNKLHYPSKPYRKTGNLFRIHSWAPLYFNIDALSTISMENLSEVASIGAMVLSQNTLSTAITQVGYSYHQGFHAGHLKFTYQGWYPVIELTGDLNDRKAMQYFIAIPSGGEKPEAMARVKGNSSVRASANIYIPFNLQSRGWVRGLMPRLYFSYTNDQYFSKEKSSFRAYTSVQGGIQYYQYRALAHRDIYPRWGFGASVQTKSAPYTGENFGSELYALTYAYFPGILPNHGVRFKATGQHQWTDGKIYYLSNITSFPRGFESQPSINYIGFSADYAWPVWLGDPRLEGFLYLKRLQVIPFVDWARNQDHRGHYQMYSAGVDLLLDFHIFRIGTPVSAGVRSIITSDQKTVFEFLINIKIN